MSVAAPHSAAQNLILCREVCVRALISRPVAIVGVVLTAMVNFFDVTAIVIFISFTDTEMLKKACLALRERIT